MLIQRFVKESKGRDIRALVVGDRVVAAMRRVAQGDEFRSNVHRGGTRRAGRARRGVRAGRPCARRRSWACKVAGVDMLEGNDGPLVMEVNSSPGLEGIETATKLDVAGAIIDYIDNQVAFPEIDVRQRLSVSTGYGVAELARARRRRHGRQDARRLRARRARHHRAHAAPRHRSVIPNPRNGTVLEAEDRLLCFGKLEEMRSMIPERRKRRPRVKRLPKHPIHEQE